MSPPRYFLAAAEGEDLGALVELERRCFTHPWTSRHFRDALGRPERPGVLLLREPPSEGDPADGILAYCCLQVVMDELHVHNLAVRPERRGEGLARRLLAEALEAGGRRGARMALLEVRRSNQAAQALYRSLGFEALSVRRNYYDRPREDAFVLQKTSLSSRGNR